MPIGPFRTYTHGVNVAATRRALRGRRRGHARGAARARASCARSSTRSRSSATASSTIALTIHAHGFSASARARRSRPRAAPSSSSAARTCPSSPCATRSSAPPPRRAPRPRPPPKAGRGRDDADEPVAADADERRRRRRRRAPRATRPDVRRADEHLARARAAAPAGLHVPDPRALPRRLVAARRRASTRASLRTFFGDGANGTILSVLNIFAGGALANLSLFALGIMPYITASIILQLMQTVVPSLEKLSKEGESGYKKITQYTRYLHRGPRGVPVRRATCSCSTTARRSAPRPAARPHRGPLHPDRDDAHGRHDAADVDGRADHPARRRQRHLAADLRLDPDLRTAGDRRLAERRHVRAPRAARSSRSR